MSERHERRLEEVLDRLLQAIQHLRSGENEQARIQGEIIRDLHMLVREQAIIISELRVVICELRDILVAVTPKQLQTSAILINNVTVKSP